MENWRKQKMTKQRIKVTQETLDFIENKEKKLYNLVQHDRELFGDYHETTASTRLEWATVYDLFKELKQEEII